MINFSRKWFDLKLAFRNLFREQWKADNQLMNKVWNTKVTLMRKKNDYSNKKSNKTN